MGRPRNFINTICANLTCKKVFYRRTHGYKNPPKYCSFECYKTSGQVGGFKKNHKINLGKRVKSTNQEAARYTVTNAIRDKKIKRPNFCQKCKIKCIPEGHHYLGYDKKNWLKIIWLCTDCHKKADKFI